MMCLAVAAQLISTHGTDGIANLHGNHVPVSLLLVPAAQPGDWVLIHAGFAIQQLDETEAQENFEILQQLSAAAERAEGGDQP